MQYPVPRDTPSLTTVPRRARARYHAATKGTSGANPDHWREWLPGAARGGAGAGAWAASAPARADSARSASCWRWMQPIVRYRRNDVLRLDPAPCPWPPLPGDRRRGGAARRSLLLTEPRRYPAPCFPGTIRRAILFADAPIADYRATREQPGQLHVALALPPDTPFAPVTAAICASTISTVTGYGCQPPDLTITEGLASPKKREPGDGAGDGAAERGTGRRPACHLARRRGR